MFAGRELTDRDGEANSKALQTRAKVIIEFREVFDPRWPELQFPVNGDCGEDYPLNLELPRLRASSFCESATRR
jgi:hypothetical protein